MKKEFEEWLDREYYDCACKGDLPRLKVLNEVYRMYHRRCPNLGELGRKFRG